MAHSRPISVVGVATRTRSRAAVLDQRRVLRQCRLVDRVRGNEQHDELGRGRELVLVALRREPADVAAQVTGMALEMRRALLLVTRVGSCQKSVERHLRVDHDEPLPGQTHQHVGAQTAIVRVDSCLRLEVAVLEHPCELDDVAQLHLAPHAAGTRLAQGAREPPSLLD